MLLKHQWLKKKKNRNHVYFKKSVIFIQCISTLYHYKWNNIDKEYSVKIMALKNIWDGKIGKLFFGDKRAVGLYETQHTAACYLELVMHSYSRKSLQNGLLRVHNNA